MLPTWRDVEIQSEIRKQRVREAEARHIMNLLPEAGEADLPARAAALVRLGDWMVSVGEQLRTRYGGVAQVDPQLQSLEQGC
ncbi:MAG: hypothetical protein PVF85_03425 [Anaerolineales bacterium]|jgi:hypothetical protein